MLWRLTSAVAIPSLTCLWRVYFSNLIGNAYKIEKIRTIIQSCLNVVGKERKQRVWGVTRYMRRVLLEKKWIQARRVSVFKWKAKRDVELSWVKCDEDRKLILLHLVKFCKNKISLLFFFCKDIVNLFCLWLNSLVSGIKYERSLWASDCSESTVVLKMAEWCSKRTQLSA